MREFIVAMNVKLEILSSLYALGYRYPLKPGVRVYRGYADFGEDEFIVSYNKRILSLYSGEVRSLAELPAAELDKMLAMPDIPGCISEIEGYLFYAPSESDDSCGGIERVLPTDYRGLPIPSARPEISYQISSQFVRFAIAAGSSSKSDLMLGKTEEVVEEIFEEEGKDLELLLLKVLDTVYKRFLQRAGSISGP